jgi:alkyl hydroperoxide reductase subunit F
MVVQNPRIRTTMIDGSLFQDEIKARQVMAVPPCFERRSSARAA